MTIAEFRKIAHKGDERGVMAKFITIGYGDRAGYDRTPVDVREAAHDHDASLIKRGVVMGIAGSPVQVRNSQRIQIETTDGPFQMSTLPIAGVAVIEAGELAEAVKLL